MNAIISEAELKDAVRTNAFIKDGSEKSCEGIKYDFVLSEHVITSEKKRAVNLDTDRDITPIIKPGEIAFVMSKESLDLPGDIFCQLSTKRKLSLEGIIILGGLIIDPLYKGKLIFGLYNISSKPYPIIPGKKLIAGVFFRTNENSNIHIPESIEKFPDDVIRMITDYNPHTNDAINSIIIELREEIRDVRKQLHDDNAWKEEFKGRLVKITDIVEDLGKSLQAERDVRQADVARLDGQYQEFGIMKKIAYGAVAALVILASGVLAVGGILLHSWRPVLENLLKVVP